MGALTQAQIDKIQIDHGLIFLNYGETGQRQLAPTRGGGTFTAMKSIRDIDYDGRMGKTAGLQVVEEINATLAVSVMDMSMDNMAVAMPEASYNEATGVLSSGIGGLIADDKYQTNVTMFAKCTDGTYKKITIKNAMSENDISIAAVPKGEGALGLEIHAHWPHGSQNIGDLYTVEEIDVITADATDTTAPTVTVVPADDATDIAVDSDVAWTFSEAIMASKISEANFIVMTVAGAVVGGALTSNAGNTVVTFTPTANLSAATEYVAIATTNIKDVNGNALEATSVVNFTTAS